MIEGVNSQILEVVVQGDFYLLGLMQKEEIQIQEAKYWEFLFLWLFFSPLQLEDHLLSLKFILHKKIERWEDKKERENKKWELSC